MRIKSYTILNIIITGIILSIFIYSASLSTANIKYPVTCVHKELLGGTCPTCGLAQGFSAIMHGKFKLAIQIQKNSFNIFLFFFLQLILRFVIFWFINKRTFPPKTIKNTDIVVSCILFFWFFRHLIVQVLYIFYKMLLTGIMD